VSDEVLEHRRSTGAVPVFSASGSFDTGTGVGRTGRAVGVPYDTFQAVEDGVVASRAGRMVQRTTRLGSSITEADGSPPPFCPACATLTSAVTPVDRRSDYPTARPQRGGGPAASALAVVLAALVQWRGQKAGVTLVAIDGYGASGKSTLAESLRAATDASVVHIDDFFVPTDRDARGPMRTPQSRGADLSREVPDRVLRSYYDVARLRVQALEPLLAGREAVFRPFDWTSGTASDDTARVAPDDLVLLEGVYSAAPELADLVCRAIYVDTPAPDRLRRLRATVAPEDWDDEWLQAEKAYFTRERPRRSFDLVVPGTDDELPPAPPCQGVLVEREPWRDASTSGVPGAGRRLSST